MSELYDILVETPPTKVILLALDQGLWDCERSLAELAALCEANHMAPESRSRSRKRKKQTMCRLIWKRLAALPSCCSRKNS